MNEFDEFRHQTAIDTIVTELGGTDYEGFPTSRLNYLQRIRILVAKEKRLTEIDSAWVGCSGDEKCCPENMGYGCCGSKIITEEY